jgi:hypothetical protein
VSAASGAGMATTTISRWSLLPIGRSG